MPGITAPPTPRTGDANIEISVVAPAHNEAENIAALVEQIERALTRVDVAFECVLVDDASTDATREEILKQMPGRAWLRCIALPATKTGTGNGQSAAFHAGFRAARGRLIAVLDADLQNDPGQIGAMYDVMRRTGADMVQGDRSRNRRDNLVRRVGSRVGRMFRRGLLGDSVRDTGCSLRLLKREIAVRLPLEFRGMHRFIPVTARDLGYSVVEMPVAHRPRAAGTTKYGLGIVQRAIPGLVDLFAVRYMRSRRRCTDAVEIHAPDVPPLAETKPDARGVEVRA